MFPEDVVAEILAMFEADRQLLQQVASAKNLADTYHPELQLLHNQNADRLEEIVSQFGWPRSSEVTDELTRACWVILQHGIERPRFMQDMLAVFKSDKSLAVDAADVARLEDRIRTMQGRKQIYGTNFDWNASGELVPTPIEKPDIIDELRKNVGLPPLADDLARMKNSADKPPKDWHKKQLEATEWAIRTGWRQV